MLARKLTLSGDTILRYDPVLWLDGKDLSTFTMYDATRVYTWGDKSRYGNSAICSLYTHMPVLSGNDVVFTSDYLAITDAPELQFGTGDFAIITLVKVLNVNPGTELSQTFTNKSYTQGFETRVYQSYAATYLANSAYGGLVMSSNMWCVLTSMRIGGVAYMRLNGEYGGNTPSSTVNVSAVGTDISLGVRPGASNSYLNGSIREVVMLKSGFNVSAVESIEDYIAQKWSL